MEEKEKMLLENEIPGTAQIRKLGAVMTPLELLELCARLAQGGYDKKLFSVLSRVYGDKKFFGGESQEGMEGYIAAILDSSVPAELKLQLFTSFRLPKQYLPDAETISDYIKKCSPKRLNIAAYFLAGYPLAVRQYDDIVRNPHLLRMYMKEAGQLELIHLFGEIFKREDKEFITNTVRQLSGMKRRFRYPEITEIDQLTKEAFESRQVFFTTKILFCNTFDVPKECLPEEKEMQEILRICINYEEKTTKDFISKYNIPFDCTDAAICRYYLANKKTQKEQALVSKFASHVIRVEDEAEKSKLIHFAFKRGGLFRLYAGCMQDGAVNPEKLKRFHYTDEQIEWCASLPGLKEDGEEN